jgi:hypothetical protein
MKTTIKILLISFVMLLNLKCQNKSTINDILMSECVWDLSYSQNFENRVSDLPGSCFRFLKNKECEEFGYGFFQTGERKDTVYSGKSSDLIEPKYWDIMDDSILIFRNYRCIIQRYSGDTLYGKFLNGRPCQFIKNCKTKIVYGQPAGLNRQDD